MGLKMSEKSPICENLRNESKMSEILPMRNNVRNWFKNVRTLTKVQNCPNGFKNVKKLTKENVRQMKWRKKRHELGLKMSEYWLQLKNVRNWVQKCQKKTVQNCRKSYQKCQNNDQNSKIGPEMSENSHDKKFWDFFTFLMIISWHYYPCHPDSKMSLTRSLEWSFCHFFWESDQDRISFSDWFWH